MPEWIPDERTRKSFGPYQLVSLRPRGGGETAHLVEFPDGRLVRVLPDDRHSGRKRYVVVCGALDDLKHLSEALAASSGMSETPGFDPVSYLVGELVRQGISWEHAGRQEPTVEEWLDVWFDDNQTIALDTARKSLLSDLEDAGWEIVRRDREGDV